ncbi:conserved hypothetical protein [Cupriavidus taiwanensis]|nr:conserved hypothetical protein [Cupriavidus taiwanensis]
MSPPSSKSLGRDTLGPPAGAPHTPNGRVRVDEDDTIAVMQIEAGPALALSGGGDARRGRISPSAVSLVPAIGDGRFFFDALSLLFCRTLLMLRPSPQPSPASGRGSTQAGVRKPDAVDDAAA